VLGGRRGFRSWARGHAIPFDPDAEDGDPERLAALDPLLEGRRLAFLGEADHFVHEKVAARLFVLRWLHARGWRRIGEEIAWSDGVRIDRFLATGDESALERIATFGYRGGERSDRDDRPTGVMRELFANQPEAAFRAEHVRYLRALRRLGGIRLFGFDVDYEPGVGYEVLAERGTPAPPRVAGESLDAEIARIDAALAGLGENRRELARGLRTLRESLAYVRLAHPAPSWDALRPAMALREQLMLEHVRHAMAELEPDEKLVLLGHDLHLARDDSRIRKRGGGVGPGGDRVPCLGTQLCAAPGRADGDVFAVWVLHDRGESSVPRPGGDRRVRSPRGSLNSLLAEVAEEVGPAFALPTCSDDPRARPLRDEAIVAFMYDARVRARVVEQADVVVFVRDVSPMRA
jgi:erythromycin esterase-like protein